jgi:hypothetical protein
MKRAQLRCLLKGRWMRLAAGRCWSRRRIAVGSVRACDGAWRPVAAFTRHVFGAAVIA